MRMRKEQVAAFGIISQAQRERNLVTALVTRFPAARSSFDDGVLLGFVRDGLAASQAQGIASDAALLDALSLRLLLGSDYANDPQLKSVAEAIAEHADAKTDERVAAIWGAAQAYRASVMGPKDALHQEALRSILGKSVEDLAKHPSRSQRDLLIQLAAMYPSKFKSIGAEQPFFDLTRLSVEACRPFELLDRWAVAMVVELMFLFGAGLMSDPLHPWAARSLAGLQGKSIDEKLSSLLAAAQTTATRMTAARV